MSARRFLNSAQFALRLNLPSRPPPCQGQIRLAASLLSFDRVTASPLRAVSAAYNGRPPSGSRLGAGHASPKVPRLQLQLVDVPVRLVHVARFRDRARI